MSTALLVEFERSTAGYGAEVRERLRSQVKPSVDRAVSLLRATAVHPAAEEWASLLYEWFLVQQQVLRALPEVPDREPLLQELIEEAVSEEITSREAKRKLAYRFLQQALDSMLVVLDSTRLLRHGRTDQEWKDAYLVDAESMSANDLANQPGLLAVIEFDAALTLALLSRRGPVEEFRRWALQAATTGRHLKSATAPTRVLAAVNARFRAQREMGEWDDEEIESEFAAWPQ